jgi:hypothetical protein
MEVVIPACTINTEEYERFPEQDAKWEEAA